WRARQDCLPTRVNLVRRGINVDSCVFQICSNGEDEINHILFQCDLAQQVRIMGSFRSKEDDLAKISTSVFITNFPLSTSAKDLFKACSQYGHVVDSFIPSKMDKNGKRFRFVKFINVFNEERLVNNLCTVWIDRYKLHANIARFKRPQANNVRDGGMKRNEQVAPKQNLKTNTAKRDEKSYVGALKGDKYAEVQILKPESSLVLGDECLVSKEMSKALFGRVKEFATLANLNIAMSDEGFVDLKIKYMGEFWVMLEFKSEESKLSFKTNVSVASWFFQIIEASLDFTVEGRVAWVEVEGIPFKLWSGNSFSRKSIREEFKVIHRGKVYWIHANETQGWVPDFNDELDEEEDQDDIKSNDDTSDIHKIDGTGDNSEGEEVPDTIFEDDGGIRSRAEGELKDEDIDNSDDPFNIYHLLNKNKNMKDNVTSGSSLTHPPGFTPAFDEENKERRPKRLNIRGVMVDGILRFLESIKSKFFNGIDDSKNKASWVQWSKALASKDNGGLGISSFFALNRGLIFKWLWRFMSHDNSLWSRVIKAVHGNDGSINANAKNISNSLWLNIIREINVLSKKGINLMNLLRFKLGNGETTNFWDDTWCEGEGSRTDFLDRWSWSLNSSGDFSVESVRSYIDNAMLPKGDYQTRWVNLVPIKVNTLAWKVMTNSLPTRFNISRRGIDIDNISYGICDSGVENVNHLFFTCDLAKRINHLIMKWWDVPTLEFDSYDEWRNWMINIRLPIKHKSMLEGVFYVEW
nr:nucleotide-binding alpha-beta plait domain-containing protein [Tanacetum cinerariifolium]